MKDQFRPDLFRQSLVGVVLMLTIGINAAAYAASPFNTGDFVKIPELVDLEVQKSEITYAQYSALKNLLPAASQTPWESRRCRNKDAVAKGFGPNYPAACISFNDAKEYVRVLNAQDPDYKYRLPTEDELRTLALLTKWKLGFDAFVPEGEILKAAWRRENSGGHAHEVCTKGAVLGLCDILGNVWEWTSTPAADYYLIAGYSWNDGEHDYGAIGYAVSPRWRDSGFGIRLVRTAK